MSATTGIVNPTGNALSDGLMSGRKWLLPVITYSFPSSDAQFDGVADGVFDYGSDGVTLYQGITLLSQSQREAARQVLEGTSVSAGEHWTGVADITNLAFAEINGFGQGQHSAAGEIRLTQANKPSAAFPPAWAYFPDHTLPDGQAGDAWFSPTSFVHVGGIVWDLRDARLGTWAWMAVMHELGHSLGLKHGHEVRGGMAALPASMDSLEFSVMTYRAYIGQDPAASVAEYGSFPQSWMMADILALQRLYGADYGHHAGDTTYSWNPATGQMSIDGVGQVAPVTNRVFLTIWDGGGTDTYDMSNYSGGVSIDLRPGKWSITSNAQRADLNLDEFDKPTQLAQGNVYNSLLYRGNEASLIENAIGGEGNDVIRGNNAANALRGGGGSDSLSGEAGSDSLIGGAGNDSLRGGSGNDSLAGGLGNDLYMVDDWYNDSVSEAGGGGYDRVMSTWDWTLHDGFERLILTGTLDAWGFGNAAANRIDGNSNANLLAGFSGNDQLFGHAGADTLIGNRGADRLDGGAGPDSFQFNDINERNDTILNYNVAEDSILISTTGFGRGLQEGMNLAATGRFVSNTTGLATSPAGPGQFIWESDAQVLWWDRDGLGAAPVLRIAALPGAVGFNASDIVVIA